MKKTNALTKVLAIVGSTLVWAPVLAPFIFMIGSLVRGGGFRLDYLMPGELFPVVLVGGALLIWAAIRARSRIWLVCTCLGASIALIVISQGIAVATGLASGAIEPTGWQFTLVVGLIIAFDLCVVLLGIAGILLLKDLFKKSGDKIQVTIFNHD